MEKFKNKYYIRLNEQGRITKTFSSAFEQPEATDILIGEGAGSQFRASKDVLSGELQGFADIENGLNLWNEQGLNQLKYNNGIIAKVTEEELQQELASIPKPEPSKIEILERDNKRLMETNVEIMLALAELYENTL